MYKSNGMEKNPADRVRRNKETYVIDHVEADGRMHGPPLPKGRKWCAETRSWWHNWRKSPQAMLMVETDWDVMLETALLHQMLWGKADDEPEEGKRRPNGAVSATQLAAEIRQRVGKFGATYEDRKKLRMSVETPASRLSEEQLIDADAERAVDYMTLVAEAAAKKK